MNSTANKKDADVSNEIDTNNSQATVIKKTPIVNRRVFNKMPNDTLFFKVWRNKVLFDQIYGRVDLINSIRKYSTKFTVKSLQEFQHRSYLKKVILINDKDNLPILSNQQSLPTPLPLPSNLIPVTTEFLELNNYCIINQGDIPDGILNIGFGDSLRNINFSYIPKSITKIKFSSRTNVTIPEGGIGLEDYRNLFFLTIDIGSLELLKHLSKFPRLRVLCINGSDGREIIIPEGITNLFFGSRFNSVLPKTYPHSLKSFRVGISFNKYFNLNSLPPNIQDILIRAYRVHLRFNDFAIFKNLKNIQYYSTKPYDKLDGKIVPDSLSNLDLVIHNNRFIFKNNNGTLELKETLNLKYKPIGN